MRSRCSIPLVSAALLFAVASGAQVPAFDAASIKVNRSGEPRGFTVGPGRLKVTNFTLRSIIRVVWNLTDQQVVGGPSWIDEDRFDIAAVAEENLMRSQFTAMAKRMLADRFALVVHTETRPVSVYALMRGRSDQQLGPRMRQSATDCQPDVPAPPPVQATLDGVALPFCGITTGDGVVRGGGVPLALFARTMTTAAGRVIVDKTGLTGRFDIVLSFNRDLTNGPSDLPSLFSAIQEQLGLKLEPQTMPLEVLVVDGAERPTAN